MSALGFVLLMHKMYLGVGAFDFSVARRSPKCRHFSDLMKTCPEFTVSTWLPVSLPEGAEKHISW